MEETMREFTEKEIKLLEKNSYTFKITKHKIFFTAAFKETFWIRYQAGVAPRKIMSDLGYDLGMFTQKQIDNYVQRIKREALSGNGFSEGADRTKRMPIKDPCQGDDATPQSMERMQNELLYLRQEVEFLKKIITADNSKRK